VDEVLEGWCTDPFGRHEARWISSGRPTFLVRDGNVESYDEPPDQEPSVVAERIVPVGSHNSIRRADDTQLEYFDPQRLIDAAEAGVDVGGRPFTIGIGRIWRSATRRRYGAEDEPT
jgi:hypothetical protein